MVVDIVNVYNMHFVHKYISIIFTFISEYNDFKCLGCIVFVKAWLTVKDILWSPELLDDYEDRWLERLDKLIYVSSDRWLERLPGDESDLASARMRRYVLQMLIGMALKRIAPLFHAVQAKRPCWVAGLEVVPFHGVRGTRWPALTTKIMLKTITKMLALLVADERRIVHQRGFCSALLDAQHECFTRHGAWLQTITTKKIGRKSTEAELLLDEMMTMYSLIGKTSL